MLSAMVNSSPGENLTPVCWIGDDGVFNVVFFLETSSGSSVYLHSLPKRSLFIWFLRGRISGASEQPKIQASRVSK